MQDHTGRTNEPSIYDNVTKRVTRRRRRPGDRAGLAQRNEAELRRAIRLSQKKSRRKNRVRR